MAIQAAAHKMINGIDLTFFAFDFQAVFNSTEAFAIFSQFQKAEYNLDALLFIHECNDLRKMVFPSAPSVSLAIHIFESYVDSVSDNTSYIQPLASTSTNHKQLCQLFKEHDQVNNEDWKLGQVFSTPMDAFEKIYSTCLLEMKTESFPRYFFVRFAERVRFVRSKLWLDFLSTKPKEFIQSMGLPKAATEYLYTDKDFEETAVVTDGDFRFIEMLLEDNNVRIDFL